MTREAVCLADACCDVRHRVCALKASREVEWRLREMGFCESAEVVRISRGTAVICLVCGVRLALNRALARTIWLRPVPAGEEAA